jgi:hypothetical protein
MSSDEIEKDEVDDGDDSELSSEVRTAHSKLFVSPFSKEERYLASQTKNATRNAGDTSNSSKQRDRTSSVWQSIDSLNTFTYSWLEARTSARTNSKKRTNSNCSLRRYVILQSHKISATEQLFYVFIASKDKEVSTGQAPLGK